VSTSFVVTLYWLSYAGCTYLNRSSQKQGRTFVGTCAVERGLCSAQISLLQLQDPKHHMFVCVAVMHCGRQDCLCDISGSDAKILLRQISECIWISRRKLTTDVMCFVQIREERWNFIPNIRASYPYAYVNSRFPLGPIPNAAASISGVENLTFRHALLLLVCYTHIYASHVTSYDGPS
jgi:hypothetical protein